LERHHLAELNECSTYFFKGQPKPLRAGKLGIGKFFEEARPSGKPLAEEMNDEVVDRYVEDFAKPAKASVHSHHSTFGSKTSLARDVFVSSSYHSCYFCKQAFPNQAHCVFHGLDSGQFFFAGLKFELTFHAYGYFKNSQGIEPEVPFIRGRVINLVYGDTGYAADCFLDFGLD
jgi:hypothetical protein